MTYQEIKNQLKAFKEQNHVIPALNSKKEVLQAALDQILATIVEATATIAPTAPEPQIKLSPLVKELDFTPARSLWNIFQFKITPDIKLVFDVVLYSIALCKFLAIKSTPYIKKALDIVLRGVVYGVVIFDFWLVPKIQLVGYQLALWAVLIAIRIKERGMAIVATTATIA